MNDKFYALSEEKQNDFESYKPDIIVVHLGNNDVFAMKEDSYIDPQTGHEYRMNADADGRVSMESAKDVTEAVCNFLKVLRKCNPGAKLIWIYGMFGTELEEAIEKGVDKFNSEEAIICGAINMKQKADYIRIPFANASDYGSNNHPGQKAHLKLGEFLAGKLECFFEND